MKKVLTLILVIILVTKVTLAQSIFSDAVALKKYGTLGEFTQQVSISIDSTNYNDIIPILYRYISIESKNEIDALIGNKNLSSEIINTLEKALDDNDSNKFISISGSLQSSGFLINVLKSTSSVLKTAGSVNVTNFADGFSQFLIARANQEMNIIFFDRFKKKICESDELRIIFPKTYELLKVTDAFEYAQIINLLREAFRTDLSNIIINLPELSQIEKYKELLKEYPEISLGLKAAAIVGQLTNGTHPADVIKNLTDAFDNPNIKNDTYIAIKTLAIISESFRSQSKERAYVPIDSLNKYVFQDPITRKIYLGLLYQQLSGIMIKDLNINEKLKNIDETMAFLEKILVSLNAIDAQINDLKKEKLAGETSSQDFYKLFSQVLNTIELGIKDNPLLKDVEWVQQKDYSKFIYVARQGNNIYQNTAEKNYSLAVINFTSVIDTLFSAYKSPIDWEAVSKLEMKYLLILDSIGVWDELSSFDKKRRQTIKEKFDVLYPNKDFEEKKALYIRKHSITLNSKTFLKYAAFMASVIEAQSPDEVKAAIETAALPVGSASLKKYSPFNISINSYLGGFIAHENIYNEPEGVNVSKTFFNRAGVYAPIGLAFSTSLKAGEAGSLSLYSQIIDIGAFASFRLAKGNEEELPETDLKNIWAPGLYLIWGIPKIPLSVGAGFQKGPNLREFNLTDGSVSPIEAKSNRTFSIVVAFDIPIFNIYSRPSSK